MPKSSGTSLLLLLTTKNWAHLFVNFLTKLWKIYSEHNHYNKNLKSKHKKFQPMIQELENTQEAPWKRKVLNRKVLPNFKMVTVLSMSFTEKKLHRKVYKVPPDDLCVSREAVRFRCFVVFAGIDVPLAWSSRTLLVLLIVCLIGNGGKLRNKLLQKINSTKLLLQMYEHNSDKDSSLISLINFPRGTLNVWRTELYKILLIVFKIILCILKNHKSKQTIYNT